MDSVNTVIIGAGTTSLSIARELALAAASSNTPKHNIAIVEVRDKPCTLASGACAGILTARKAPEKLTDLFILAGQGWQEILDDHTSAINFHEPKTVHVVSPAPGDSKEKMPSWFKAQVQDEFSTIGDTMGRITTSEYNAYLYAECKRLGVHFLFDSAVVGIFDADISTAKVVNLLNQSTIQLPFTNLVIAAGTWTPGIFRSLYTYNTLYLENYVRCMPWYQITTNSSNNEDEDVALIHTFLANKSPELEPEITFSAQTGRNLITICALPSHPDNSALGPNDAIDPTASPGTRKAVLALKKAAGPRIAGGESKLENSAFGYSYVGTASQDGCPVIAKVPEERLGRMGQGGARAMTGASEMRRGVWLCYGFGMYGTALAPGAAKVLARKMGGEKVGVGESVVGFKEPRYY